MQDNSDAPVIGARFQAIAWPWLSRVRLWQIWLGWAIVSVIARFTVIRDLDLSDADDWMRLLQVRAFLTGQNWFDVHQYRLNPPFGADLQWSRLVDLPIAFFVILFRPLFDQGIAERIAITCVPLLQLGIAMIVLERMMKHLGVMPVLRILSISLLPLNNMLSFNFSPGRVDHHGWQAIGVLIASYFLVRFTSNRAAVAAGALAALTLTISLEVLPLVAAMAAALSAAFIVWNVRTLAPFLTSLSIAGIILFMLARAPGHYFQIYCDAVSWPHLAAFSGSAALAWAAQNIGCSRSPIWRTALLSSLPLFAVPVVLGSIGICAINPFAGLSPAVHDFWYLQVREGLPIHRQSLLWQIILIWNGPVMIAALWFGVLRIECDSRRKPWLLLFAVGLTCWILSLNVMRSSIFVQILMTPFLALLIDTFLPSARAMHGTTQRILLTIACAFMVLPSTPLLIGTIGQTIFTKESIKAVYKNSVLTNTCDLSRLNRLAPSHLFASLDISPEILGLTHHTAVMSGHHRNNQKMQDVLEAFGGNFTRSRDLIKSSHARYVVFCSNSGDSMVAVARGTDSLMAQLQSGKHPSWLLPVPKLWDAHLRVYAIQ